MEKKKRSKCVTSHRKVFTVNEANPKEKVIYDFLLKQYNESDSIKDILYEYIITNNLQTAQHSANIVPISCKYSAINDAVMCNESVNDSTNNYKEIINENTNDFNVNLDDIENSEIKIDYNKEEEIKEANNNALDFLKNGF